MDHRWLFLAIEATPSARLEEAYGISASTRFSTTVTGLLDTERDETLCLLYPGELYGLIRGMLMHNTWLGLSQP